LPADGLAKDIVNVGGEWSPTIWDAASLVQERCKAVLGFQPELTRIPPRVDEASVALDYRLDVLRQSGFQPESDKVEEIDRLLAFCRVAFN